VRDGALADFERWWAKEGAAAFRAFDGLVSVDTWVDRTNGPSRLTSVFGFRNHAALNRFTTEPAAVALGEKFDGFVGEHDHQIFSSAPLYRVEGLSLAAAAPPPLGGGE